MDRALDHPSGNDGAGHRYAFLPFPPRGRPLGVCRPNARKLPELPEGSWRSPGALHVPVHSGRAEPLACERGRGSRPVAQHSRTVLFFTIERAWARIPATTKEEIISK